MRKIKYLIIDVDGTMTDGGIYYDSYGNELKKFCSKDAAGYFVCKKLGIKTIVISGRECNATKRRMEELGIDFLYQGVNDKKVFIETLLKNNNISKEDLGYIGDDLNDYESMKLAGFIACPKNGCKEVKKISDYVSLYDGGDGAVRDIIEHLLGEEEWSCAVSKVYGIKV